MKKILISGGAGYLGTFMAQELLKNYKVFIYDKFYFPWILKNKNKIKNNKNLKFINKDISDANTEDFKNIDIVCDLNGISNDPSSELNAKYTWKVNYHDRYSFAKKAKKAGVKRYIFNSTCSVYGFNEKIVNEKDTTKPISLYSKFCKKTEDYIKKKLKKKFVTFRLGTLYGWSPRMRYDIAINKLIRDGYFLKKIEINGGDQFRFFCYNKLAVDAIIEAIDNRKLMGQIFNLGNVNFNINDLTKKIVKKINIKDLQVIKDQFNVDKRSYKVSSSKFKKITNNKFTNHDFEKTIMETYKKIKTDKKPFDKNKVTLNLYKKILKLQK